MEEIKGMLKAVLEAQQVTNAKIEAMGKRMETIEKRMEEGFSELKQGQADIQEDIRLLVRDIGEHDFQIRRLKKRVME